MVTTKQKPVADKQKIMITLKKVLKPQGREQRELQKQKIMNKMTIAMYLSGITLNRLKVKDGKGCFMQMEPKESWGSYTDRQSRL